MKIKEFFSNIFMSILSSVVQKAVVAVITVIIGCLIAGPQMLLIVIPGFILILILRKIFWGFAKFKWGHIYSKNIHTYDLYIAGKATYKETTCPKKCNNLFENRMKSTYMWDDVELKSLEFDSGCSANFKCVVTDKNSNVEEYAEKELQFNGNINKTDITIDFFHDRCDEVTLEAEMLYNNNTAPQLYVEIKRPIKYLEINIRVHENVRVNNVKVKRIPLYGEYNIEKNSVQGTPIEGKDESGCKVYKVKIKNPKLLHKYVVFGIGFEINCEFLMLK